MDLDGGCVVPLAQTSRRTDQRDSCLSLNRLYGVGVLGGRTRISQYLGPQIAGAANAVGQAKNVDISTDVQEIRARLTNTTNPNPA